MIYQMRDCVQDILIKCQIDKRKATVHIYIGIHLS
jgi:hypothetical protein